MKFLSLLLVLMFSVLSFGMSKDERTERRLGQKESMETKRTLRMASREKNREDVYKERENLRVSRKKLKIQNRMAREAASSRF